MGRSLPVTCAAVAGAVEPTLLRYLRGARAYNTQYSQTQRDLRGAVNTLRFTADSKCVPSVEDREVPLLGE